MEKKEIQRYIDWLVEEILMNPNQRSRKDIELMKRGEFESRTVTLVTNLINELLDKAREEVLERVALETRANVCECGEKWSETDLGIWVEQELSKLKDNK